MEQKRIDRINELAHKARDQGLTPAEIQERDILRKEYIAAFRASLEGQLQAITVVEEDGSTHKLRKKK